MNRRTFAAAASAFIAESSLAAAHAFQKKDNQSSAPDIPPLKQIGARCGLHVGMAADRGTLEKGPPGLINFLASNFNILAPNGEMKWHAQRPTPHGFNFEDGDWMLSFATDTA